MSNPTQSGLTRRDTLRFGGLLLLAGGVAACGGNTKSGGSGSGNSPYSGKVSVAHLETLAAAAPLVIANTQNFYRKSGSKFQNISFSGGSDTVRGIVATTGIGMPATISALTAYSKGQQDLRIVSGIFNSSQTVYLVPSDSPVKSVADLKGKKLAVSEPTSPSYYYARLAIKRAGLDPDNDVQILFLGDVPAMWTAAKNGTVAACNSVAPFSTALVVNGEARVIADASKLKPVQAENTLVATTEFIQDHKSAVRDWLGGVKKAIDLIHDDLDTAAKAWVDGTDLDLQVAKTALETYSKAYSLTVDRAGIQNELEVALSLKGVGSPFKLDAVLDDSFVS